MADPLSRLRRFLRELKRRNVYKVAVAYIAVAFVVLQGARLLVPALVLPEWFYRVVVGLALLGLPLALVLAWAFEMTPEGMRRTSEGEAEGRSLHQWIGLAFVVVLAGGVWYATAGDDGESAVNGTSATDTAARTASAPRDTAVRPRVAVLPFENIAPDSTDDYFARGMHEEVLNQLAKISELQVISRTSVMGYADTEKRVPEISRELGGVSAVLEGTVRRAGNRVRITTQLIDAPEDEHLWSTTYDRTLSPQAIFEIQADIAKQIAGALQTELARTERERIESAPTDDLAAYDAYLRGRNEAMDSWHALDPEHLGPAVRHLRRAAGRDSSFAEAYAWLGFAYTSRAFFTGEYRWRDSALAAVDRALTLAPDLAQAHAVRGFAYQGTSLDTAGVAYRRALDLQPNHWLAADGMADLSAYRGEYAQAVEWSHRSLRLNPRWEYGLAFMGHLLRRIGMLEEAEAWFRHVREMNPGNAMAVRSLTSLQLSRGEVAKARETASSFRTRLPDHPVGVLIAAEIALHRKNPERARRLLKQVDSGGGYFGTLPHRSLLQGLSELRSGRTERGRRRLRQATDSIRYQLETRSGWYDQEGYTMLARGLAALGRTDAALRHLEAAMKHGMIAQEHLRVDPFFADLRSDPGFRKILKQMKSRQRAFRREVRQLGLDLHPPGAEEASTTTATGSSD